MQAPKTLLSLALSDPCAGVLDTVDVEPSLDGMPRTTLAYGDGPGAPEVGQTRSNPVDDDLRKQL